MKTRKPFGRARRLTLSAALGCAAVASIAPAASAEDRRCVDPPSVYVRNYPAGAAWTQLYQKQTFGVYEYRDSGWARGFAYGNVNTNRSPFIQGWNYASFPNSYDVWIQSEFLGKHVNHGEAC